jgi:hypothetical protein
MLTAEVERLRRSPGPEQRRVRRVGTISVGAANAPPLPDGLDLRQADPETQRAQRESAVQVLEAQLMSEGYDPDWAGPMEAELAGVMTEELQQRGNELVDASCGSTLCRVEVGHQDQRAEMKFVRELIGRQDLIDSGLDVLVHRLSAEHSLDGVARSVFFIAREGHRLPATADHEHAWENGAPD